MPNAITWLRDDQQIIKNHQASKEDTMKTPTVSKEKVQVDVNHEIMEFAFTLGVVGCALIGLWAVACFIVGLFSFGPLQMLRGYITAITGI